MTQYRAIPKPKGLYVIERRMAKYLPYEVIGTAIKFAGVVSFDGENYKSVQHLLRELGKELS